MNHETLEEYRCRKCGRLFYINASQRHPLDIDFGCPYGCDDNGERVRAVVAEIRETEDDRAGKSRGIKDYRVTIELSEEEFEMSMGRKPRDQEEFNDWGRFAENGLFNGHIDWDILYECTCDAMLRGGEAR